VNVVVRVFLFVDIPYRFFPRHVAIARIVATTRRWPVPGRRVTVPGFFALPFLLFVLENLRVVENLSLERRHVAQVVYTWKGGDAR
jgi:hypothetical protein